MKYLRQYEIANEIARCRSLSKAAKELGLSQPTLSKYLQKIETDLGVELFDRTTVPLRVTSAGEKFLAAGSRIQDIDRQLQKELTEIKSSRSQVLKVGISPTRAPHILPGLLEKYSELCGKEKEIGKDGSEGLPVEDGNGKIIVRERTISRLSAELLSGDLDLIISLLVDETRGFAGVPLFSESLLLAVPKKWAGLDVEQILGEKPYISLGSGQQLWSVAKTLLAVAGGGDPAIECRNIMLALALVNRGLGATLAPSYMVGDGEEHRYANVAFMPLPEEYYRRSGLEKERKVCIFYRHDQFLSGAERRFIEACKQAAAETN